LNSTDPQNSQSQEDRIPVNSIREGSTVAILSVLPEQADRLIRKGSSILARQQLKWWQGESDDAARPKGVPLLFHNNNSQSGEIGWLSLISAETGRGVVRSSTERCCRDTLKTLSKFLGYEAPTLDAHLDLFAKSPNDDLDGSSASLAILLDWVFDVLGLAPQDDQRCPLGRWAATGGWDLEKKCFTPVDSNALTTKAEAALRWGYGTLILVDGQTMPADFPPEINLIELPPEPIEALLVLLEQEAMTDRIEQDLSKLRLLLKTIRAGWVNNPKNRFAQPPNLVNTLHEHAIRDNKATLRVLTADILCRHAFHSGSDLAFDYLAEIRENIDQARILDPRTSNYFRHEWFTSPAEGLIDLGYWDQSQNSVQKYWKVIEARSQRDDVPNWDIPRHFGIFALNNMISFREDFVARITEDKDVALSHLSNCLDRRILYQDLWSDFWDGHQYREDTYPERQGNLLIELWWSAYISESEGRISKTGYRSLRTTIEHALNQLDHHIQVRPTREPNDYDLLGRWSRAFMEDSDLANQWEELIFSRMNKLLIHPKGEAIQASSPLRWALERTLNFGGSNLEKSRELLIQVRNKDLLQGLEKGMSQFLKSRTTASLAYNPECDVLGEDFKEQLLNQDGELGELAKVLTKQGTYMGYIERCPY
jgi:hypothetical protein